MQTFDSYRRLVRAGEWKDPTAAFLVFARAPESAASVRKFRTRTEDGEIPSVPSLSSVLASEGTLGAPLQKSASSPYEDFIFVGRAVTADIVLEDESISKSHAAFHRQAGEWLVKDVRSRNGTYVNGRRLVLGEQVKIASGAQITFGAIAGYFIDLPHLRRILAV